MKVDNAVLNVLSAAHMEGNQLKLVGTLERPLYVATNKVLEAAGGKWDKKAKAHVFPVDAADAMEQIIQTGEVTLIRTIQQDFGYFPTPRTVVDQLIALADIKPGMAVLEPSAGQGAIATRLWDCEAAVNCFELLPKNVAVLRAAGHRVVEGDFLEVDPEPVYDRVVMNPPFARQADIAHVQHAMGFLRPDGLLVSVMSAGVTFRDNHLTTNFRHLLDKQGGWIKALPDAAFKESGTMVRTVIVVIPSEGRAG